MSSLGGFLKGASTYPTMAEPFISQGTCETCDLRQKRRADASERTSALVVTPFGGER